MLTIAFATMPVFAASDAFWTALFSFMSLVITSIAVPYLNWRIGQTKKKITEIQEVQEEIKTKQVVSEIKADIRAETLNQVHGLTNGLNKQLTQAVEDAGIANTAAAVTQGKSDTAAAVAQGVVNTAQAFRDGVKSEADKNTHQSG